MKEKITMQSSSSISINDCFEKYLKKCTVRNLSDKTICVYRKHYKILTEFVDVKLPISTFTSDMIDDFIIYVKETHNCNDISINSLLRSIRAFLYYAMENGNIANFTIRMLKTDKKIKPTYNNEELLLLLRKPNKDKCDFTEYRIWALTNYFLATGNRISSALDLRICDIDFTNGIIQVNKAKNRKAQIIPLSKSLEIVLTEYLSFRGGEPTDYVFCNSFGDKGNMRSFEGLIAKYNTNRGVMKTSAHLYRHTFAKNWILNGGDIFRLQKILGHSDLTVVKEYVNMFSNDLSIDFDKFNPLDNMNFNNIKKVIHMK